MLLKPRLSQRTPRLGGPPNSHLDHLHHMGDSTGGSRVGEWGANCNVFPGHQSRANPAGHINANCMVSLVYTIQWRHERQYWIKNVSTFINGMCNNLKLWGSAYQFGTWNILCLSPGSGDLSPLRLEPVNSNYNFLLLIASSVHLPSPKHCSPARCQLLLKGMWHVRPPLAH